jgi:CheY-like chemotaxis protein
MRILIADDQERVRFALRVLLAQQPGVQVVGEAANGEALLAQASAVAADLALVDWELPRLAEAGGLPDHCLEQPARRTPGGSSSRRHGLREQGRAAGTPVDGHPALRRSDRTRRSRCYPRMIIWR